MYKLLGQRVVGSKWSLDRILMSETESSGHEDLSNFVKTRRWYEMTLMDAQEQDHRSMVELYPYQSLA